MKGRDSGRSGMSELRRRAEQRLGGAPPNDVDALKQLHELQVHQIELELQNQELQRIRDEVEEGLARYTALYDFAPIGYFTLDRNSTIAKLNLTGAKLLEHSRSELMGRRLADFVGAESREIFAKFLQRVFASGTVETLELELSVTNARPLFAHVEAVADETGESCRAVVVDITARREAEQRADELLRENRSLTRRMFSVQETERRELARELHDELGQWLTAIQAEAEAIRGSASIEREPRLLASAQAIVNNAGEVHRLIRQMLQRLRPSLLDSLGLAESLQELTMQWQAHHAPIACDLEMIGEFHDVPTARGITIYRIVQEALTNVAKHANAERVSVRLERDRNADPRADTLRLRITDNGKGLEPERSRSGLGLMGMRERVIAADGEFRLHSKPQQGVQIEVRLPLWVQPKVETER